MSSGEAIAGSLSAWSAESWDELESVYRELMPEDRALQRTAENASTASNRRFRGADITSWQAGVVFEKWILEAFRLSSPEIEVVPAFTVSMLGSAQAREQIDGAVLIGWRSFLVESKFWPANTVDFGPIALLQTQVDQRPPGTMGLLFAPFGFSPAAIESTQLVRPLRVLLFGRTAISSGLAARSMMEPVRRKWVHAVKYGSSSLPEVL